MTTKTCKIILSFTIILLLTLSQAGSVQGASVYIDDVPYYHQEQGYWCGPAVLQMVLEYWGVEKTQTEIASVVYDAEGKITSMFSMKNYTRNLGFNNTDFVGDINQLKAYVNQGLPAVVLQKISATNPYGHYRVVVGYDDRNSVFITNDPLNTQNYNITYHEFTQLWKEGSTFSTQNWTFVIEPTSTTPTVTPSLSPSISEAPSPSTVTAEPILTSDPTAAYSPTNPPTLTATPTIPEFPSALIAPALIIPAIALGLMYRKRQSKT